MGFKIRKGGVFGDWKTTILGKEGFRRGRGRVGVGMGMMGFRTGARNEWNGA